MKSLNHGYPALPKFRSSEATYLRRKRLEIKTLQSFDENSVKAEFLNSINSTEDCFQKKLLIRNSLRAQFSSSHSESLIESRNRVIHYHGFKLDYAYQRNGLLFVDSDALESIYPPLKNIYPEFYSSGFFSSSGQSVITLLFEALCAVHGPPHVTYSDDLYFETNRYLHMMKNFWSMSVGIPNQLRLAYWDSSCERSLTGSYNRQKEMLKGADLFAIDTTCYERGSPHLKSLIVNALNASVPCVLLRSHMKLDCLGSEYGRLGSFVFIGCNSWPKKKIDFFSKFVETSFELGRYMGSHASIGQIYPFLNSAKFNSVNDLWIQSVRTSGMLARKFFQENPISRTDVQATFFNHNLFFVISLNRLASTEEMQDWAAKLNLFLLFHDVPNRGIPSYPWDFLAYTVFHSKSSPENEHKDRTSLRVSMGDLDKPGQVRALKVIRDWTDRFK